MRATSFLIGTLLLSCVVSTALAAGFTNVTASEAYSMIDSDQSLVVLDVRSQSEYNSGHIRNAKLIPVTELEGRLGELNTTDDILVYCKSGGRSATASQILVDNGFLYVFNILGGIDAWKSQGYPVYVKYPSIQDAINNANEGDTLFVSSGTYHENLVVNKTILLIGEDKRSTIIDGNGTGNVVSIAKNNTKISGFTIQKSGHAGPNHGVYIMPNLNGTFLSSNIVTKNQYGITLGEYSHENTLTQNAVTDNEIGTIIQEGGYLNSLFNNSVAHNGYGVYLYYSHSNAVFDNEVTNCDYAGIILYYTNDSLVENNLINDSQNGIWLEHSNSSIIWTNNVNSNNNQGILLSYSYNNTIIRNLVQYSGYANINVYASNTNVIKGNIMQEHWLAFIIQVGSSGNIILENTFNGSYAIFFSDDNIFCHNNFLGGLSSPSAGSNIWDNSCEGNYWSNYNGTDTSIPSDGIGDTYLPWEGVDNYPLMNLYWNPADINHDLKVDIKDIASAALAYGSYPSHPKWNPHADITGPIPLVSDGKVNIRDIGLIAINFGKDYNP